MSTPAIVYVSPRLRGAITEAHADTALDYITRRIGNPNITLPAPMPHRIARQRAWMRLMAQRGQTCRYPWLPAPRRTSPEVAA